MQCKCGGSTVDRKQKVDGCIFEYARCPSCGRIGNEILKQRRSGKTLLKGHEAKEFFGFYASCSPVRDRLDAHDLRIIGEYDEAGRWYPYNRFRDYFSHIRKPSRDFPLSYAKAAQTKKFATWLIKNHSEFADLLKLSLKGVG